LLLIGICHYIDKTKYKGKWKDDKRNGEGVCNYPDGSEYNGDWKEDLKDGKGNTQLNLRTLLLHQWRQIWRTMEEW